LYTVLYDNYIIVSQHNHELIELVRIEPTK